MTINEVDEIEQKANDIYYKYFQNGPEVEFTCKSKEPGGLDERVIF
ncbi:MAG: hypothetical protein J6V90_00350 [Treponema sp.]|nr:hypothetical protein [Treponema sp.]